MSPKHVTPFAYQTYLNLETYGNTGMSVAIPVGWGEEHGTCDIDSLADAGKMKYNGTPAMIHRGERSGLRCSLRAT